MITDEDILKLKQVFLTKEDAKIFATKEDLKQSATKDDLKQFATKKDLEKLITREDWLNNNKELLEYISTVDKANRQDTRDQILSLKKDIQQMMKEFKEENLMFKDQILYEIVKLREDVAICTSYQDRLENHEERIEKIENHIEPKPIPSQ